MSDYNLSMASETTFTADIFKKQMRLANFSLLWAGFISNSLLSMVLVTVGRRQCSTYFLLILMAICDALYCAVHLSIVLTIDHYINIINHQILCPLSFFLTPFTFTGSTLFLLICLIHFITNYVRKYDTTLGQINGRLSVVFVLAFVLVRSVLGSTSVELITLNPNEPDSQYCTIDMNTPKLVETVQHFTHIFSEVTDMLIYLGWIIIVVIYGINILRCKKSYFYDDMDPASQTSMNNPLSYASLLILYNNNNVDLTIPPNSVAITLDSRDTLNASVEGGNVTSTNKQRHSDISLIIVSITLMSILLYLPMMAGKYSTLYFAYYNRTLLDINQIDILQFIQHTAHSLCLSLRFIPYILFDRRIHTFFHQLVGIRIIKTNTRRSLSRRRNKKLKHQYTCQCRFYRRKEVLSLIRQERLSELDHESQRIMNG